MMLKIEQTGKGASRRITVTGDPQAFFWLQSAAGNAMNGQVGNTFDGLVGGGRVELAPVEVAGTQGKRSTAHLQAKGD